MNELDALNVVAAAGVPTVPARHAQTAREAADAAADLGFPVVLKVLSADILHKSDIGGVRLGVADRAAAETAFAEVVTSSCAAHPNAAIDVFLVAPMVTDGVETIHSLQRDPVFGPIVMFGLGGIFVEALKDVTFRAALFDEAEARTMIEPVATYPHLTGLRGQPPADLVTRPPMDHPRTPSAPTRPDPCHRFPSSGYNRITKTLEGVRLILPRSINARLGNRAKLLDFKLLRATCGTIRRPLP